MLLTGRYEADCFYTERLQKAKHEKEKIKNISSSSQLSIERTFVNSKSESLMK